MMSRAALRIVVAALMTMAAATPWAVANERIIANPNPDRTWASKVGGIFTSGKSIAVVIGISNYIGERAGGYPALQTAKLDAEKMINFLINDAGFDTIYVLTDNDATKQKIDQLMTDIIPGVVKSTDRFLFYWSGHGDQRQNRADGSTFGFLPLTNSKRNEFYAMVSIDDISRWDRYLSARHSLFVLDACLSGLAGAEKKSPRDSRLEQLSLPAHHLLTAGTANENVISGDKWTGGLFTDSFIVGAKGQASGSLGVVSLFSLIEFIQERVVIEKQAVNWSKSLTPQLRSLQAGDGGFYFVSTRQVAGPAPVGSRANPGANSEPKGTVGGSPQATRLESTGVSPEQVAMLMEKPARDFIVAGRSNQKLPSYSPIPKHLLAALGGAADYGRHGVVSTDEISNYLADQMRDIGLTPVVGRLPNPAFAGGRFLFRVIAASTAEQRTLGGSAPDDPLRHGHALLIGNAHYRDWPQLDDVPVQLDELAKGLQNHFDTVETVKNLETIQLQLKINWLLENLWK
jgi:hypothetical protein